MDAIREAALRLDAGAVVNTVLNEGIQARNEAETEARKALFVANYARTQDARLSAELAGLQGVEKLLHDTRGLITRYSQTHNFKGMDEPIRSFEKAVSEMPPKPQYELSEGHRWV